MAEAYLTFERGPGEATAYYLEELRRHRARATFFVVGGLAEDYPQTIKDIHSQGHAVGNNGFSNVSLAMLERSDDIRLEIAETDASIARIGVPKPTLFRPPYGATRELVDAVAHEQNLEVCLWDLDPQDYTGLTAGKITQRVLDDVEDGSVIRLTDGRDNVLEALPEILEGLREKGFSLRKL